MKDNSKYFKVLHHAVYHEVVMAWDQVSNRSNIINSARADQIDRLLSIDSYPGLCAFVNDAYSMSMQEWIDSYPELRSIVK